MMPPAETARQFLPAILLGCALGVFHGFLRPLRLRIGWPAELPLCAAMVWGWLYLSFAVCRGDLRPAYTLCYLFSAILWDRTLGRWVGPLFSFFWQGIFQFLGFLSRFWKNFSRKCKNYAKILFATGKKEGIINWNNRLHFRRRTGGKSHGT